MFGHKKDVFRYSLMLSFYTAINEGVVLSPFCVPEKVGEKSINKK